MGLADVVRSAVATANTVTAGLQAEVSHAAWIGNYTDGSDRIDTPVTRKAIVNLQATARRLPGGEIVQQKASVLFLEVVPPNGAAGRRAEPIDPRDQITLQDGTTGPILYVGGPLDPATGRGFITEVILG